MSLFYSSLKVLSHSVASVRNVASSSVSGRPTFSAWLQLLVMLPVLVLVLIVELCGSAVSFEPSGGTKAAVV